MAVPDVSSRVADGPASRDDHDAAVGGPIGIGAAVTPGTDMLVQCPECGYGAAQLRPGAAAIACRSFGRRWRELFDGATEREEDGRAVLHRRAPGGWSAIERCEHVTAVLDRTAGHLLLIRTRAAPSLDEFAAGSSDEVPWPGDDPEAPLAAIAEAGERAAEQMDLLRLEDWNRVGSLAGVSVSAFSVVRSAVHEAVHHLRLAGDDLAAASVPPADDD